MSDNIKVICDRSDIVAVADNIRTLTGTTGEMTLGQMATATPKEVAEDLTAELNAQAEIITQLEAAVAGKAGSGGAVETCTVNITCYDFRDYTYVSYVKTDGSLFYAGYDPSVISSTITHEVPCGKLFACQAITSASGSHSIRIDGILITDYDPRINYTYNSLFMLIPETASVIDITIYYD